MVEMSGSSRWEKELAQFQKVLANPTGQAIVIVGPEGSGKSDLLANMVMRARKGDEFHCEANILRVGPNDPPNHILPKIGRGSGGPVARAGSEAVLIRLRKSVKEFGDLHREVIGVDVDSKMSVHFGMYWFEIISQLPEKVKFIFAQRPDGMLAANKQFMALPNVVRIDVETGLASDKGRIDKSELRAAFLRFVTTEKDYPEGCVKEDNAIATGRGKVSFHDLTAFFLGTEKVLWIADLGLWSDTDEQREPKVVVEIIRRTSVYKGIRGFIVRPGQNPSENECDVFEVPNEGPATPIDPRQFPTYESYRNMLQGNGDERASDGGDDEKLDSFRNEIDDAGKEVLDKLIELIRSESSFSIKAASSNYINVRIKKPRRVAFQIHRIADESSQLGLAIAGWSEDDPEIKNKHAIVRDDIRTLSGLHDTTQENYWLKGKIKSRAKRSFPPYEAKVYIIGPGIEEDAWGELKTLLDFAKEIAGRGIIKEIASKISKALKVLGRIATLRSDEVSDVDDLGRETLIDAFADTIIHTDFNNGFTLALMGNWGEGKSSVMKILKRKLKERQKGRFDFALFNAWEYEQTGKTAAGLAQEVVKGLREKNFFKRQLQRVAFAYKENKLSLVIPFCLLISPFLLYLLRHYYDLTLLTDYLNNKPELKKLFGDFINAIYVILPLFGIHIFKKNTEHPLDIKLQTYFKLPDYGEHLGLIPVLKRHITTLCKLKLNTIRIPFTKIKIGKDRKLLVFVDDLDRCKSSYIAETLDAIRLVMTIPNVIVMICIDHRIAFKAIERHYRTLAEVEEEDGSRRSSEEVARDYLGKIIQLPVRLEPVKHGKLKKYVYGKLFLFEEEKWEQFKEMPKAAKVTFPKVTGSLNVEKGLQSGTSEEVKGKTIRLGGKDQGFDVTNDANALKPKQEKREQERKSDDKKSGDIEIKDRTEEGKELYRLAGLFEFSNPRQLLRLHNSFRFLKALGRGGENDTLDMLRMLFWQEFLHNWPVKVRGRCMATLIDKVHAEKVNPIVKRVLDKVRDDIVQLFNGENYAELAEFVRIVVLPHNEEGIIDTKEDINEWLKKEKEAEEKEASKKTIAGE